MKVAIDISPLQSGHKVRGVGFYLKYLTAALREQESDIDFQFFSSIDEVKNADIVHYPYFDPFSSANLLALPASTVVTIHDLTPIKFRKQFPVGIKGNIYWLRNKLKAKKLQAIITDSESSKNDIITFLNYPKDKIHVVYLAAGDAFKPKEVSSSRKKDLIGKYHLPENFALYVGDVTWNKNLPRIINACIEVEVPLVLVGKAIAQDDFDRTHPWNSDLVKAQSLIKSSKLITSLGFIMDEDLVDLYRIATVFVMPSLYEGFGLPIVEAMQAGCPVITSKEGSLPEVGGEAVEYVDAYSTQSIGKGIEEVFISSGRQQELRRKGLEQAAKFSWKKTALETIKVYESICHEK